MPGNLGPSAVLAVALALPAAADPVTSFTLENGLEVVVIEDHRAPVAVQMIWYRVGSADEPAGASGIAHFLEHLMFKGTEKIGPNEFSAIVEAQGGDDNAFTSWDYTAYFQRVAGRPAGSGDGDGSRPDAQPSAYGRGCGDRTPGHPGGTQPAHRQRSRRAVMEQMRAAQ